MKRIVIVRHESIGCMHNMHAVAKELGTDGVSEVDYVCLSLRNKLLIPFVMGLVWLSSFAALSFVRRLSSVFFKGDLPHRAQYDVVISTLGSGEAPSVFLAALYPEAVHIHIGTPRRLPRRYFQVIITNFGTEPRKGEIALSQALTRFDSRSSGQSTLATLNGKNIAALLIGGTAAEVNFDQNYWKDMLSFILAYAKRYNVQWVITTSPRTSQEVVDTLHIVAGSHPEHIAHYSVYTGNGKSYLHEYLQSCQRAFVTAESVSMIADAMAYPVPVFALTNPDAIKNKRINGFLDMQRNENTLQCVNMCDIREGIVPVYTALVDRPKWSDSFWAQLMELYPAVAEKLKE